MSSVNYISGQPTKEVLSQETGTSKFFNLKILLISSFVSYLLLNNPSGANGTQIVPKIQNPSVLNPYEEMWSSNNSSLLTQPSLLSYDEFQCNSLPNSFMDPQNYQSISSIIKRKNFTSETLNRLQKIIKRDPNFLKNLIDKGIDINAKNKKDLTLLYLAVKANKKKLVSALLDNGADVNVKVNDGGHNFSPLHLAIQAKDKDLVDLLLVHGVDINVQSWSGLTPLALAVKNEDIDLINFLIDQKADINAIPRNEFYNDTPLLIAIKQNNIKIINLLLQKGADVNQMILIDGSISSLCPTKNKVSLLYFAITQNLEEISKLLLKYGAETEKRDSRTNRTALHWACDYQNYWAVQLLLQYNADIYATDLGGYTPDELTSDENIKNILAEKKKSCSLKESDKFKLNSLYIRAQDDYNGALRSSEALSFVKSISKSCNNKKVTVNSFKQLIDSLNQYSEESLDLLVIHAHGMPNRITLDKDSPYIVKSFFTDPELKEALKVLKPNATIILFSCSTAKKANGENVLDFFLRHVPKGVTIFAPDEDTYAVKIYEMPDDRKLEVEFACRHREYIREDIYCTVKKSHNLFFDCISYFKSKLFYPFY